MWGSSHVHPTDEEPKVNNGEESPKARRCSPQGAGNTALHSLCLVAPGRWAHQLSGEPPAGLHRGILSSISLLTRPPFLTSGFQTSAQGTVK